MVDVQHSQVHATPDDVAELHRTHLRAANPALPGLLAFILSPPGIPGEQAPCTSALVLLVPLLLRVAVVATGLRVLLYAVSTCSAVVATATGVSGGMTPAGEATITGAQGGRLALLLCCAASALLCMLPL